MECAQVVHKFIQIVISFFLFVLSACSFSGKIVSTAASSQGAAASPYQLSVSDKIVPEYGIASLTVNLSQAHTQNISFTYYTQNQSAASGTDYIAVSGAATITAGQTQVIISVPVADNFAKSSNKTFFFNISSATNAEISSASSIVQILDDDYNPMSGIAQITTGDRYSCSRTTTGGVKCWGFNITGQLGDGTTTSRTTAVDVTGLTSGVASIAADHSSGHSCAVTISGGAKCWGYNFLGQVGDGTTTNRSTATDVTGLTSGVASITTGGNHTCALTTSGGVKCWGANTNGQIGDGTTTQRNTAVDVTGLTSGVAAIKAGNTHTCALTTTGGVKCWGANSSGQLGDGTTTQRLTSVDVTGLTSGVSAIATGGAHSCALTVAGGAKCWGANSSGQLGDGTTTQRTAAVDVTGLTSGIAAIATGGSQSCALTTSGGAKCWGGNTSGQIGDGTSTDRTTAVDVTGLITGVSAITTGNNHSCALTTSGIVSCWGSNSNGQIGDGITISQRTITVDVSGLTSGVSAISTGQYHSCSLTTAGGLKCWGANSSGQLGDGTTTQPLTAVDVFGLTSGVSAIATGGTHSCALTTSGGVKCWGTNSNGQVGDGTTTQRNAAVDLSGLTSGVSAIATGQSHSCALTTTGGVKCWGLNTSGQIGDGTTTQRTTAVDVSGLTSGVSTIAIGGTHSCALTTSGGVKCWGNNSIGQLGDGTTTQRTSPVDVTGLTSGFSAIATGNFHSCALTTTGGMKCWGNNGNGQIGDGTTTQRNTAVDVSGLSSGVSAIATGSNHSCVLTTAGGVKCWGANNDGQIGDGTTTNRTTALDVLGLASGVSSLATGIALSHSCALTTAGGVKCWGYNANGQLGMSYNNLIPNNVAAP
jgi:alpha-tubulin suppressor-like RCC1 family protein